MQSPISKPPPSCKSHGQQKHALISAARNAKRRSSHAQQLATSGEEERCWGKPTEAGLQEEQDAGCAVQRRRVGEAGDARDEARMHRLNMQAHAMFYKGLTQVDVLWEELVQVRAREAELNKNAAALQSIIESKDSEIQSKDALLRRLKAENARLVHKPPPPPPVASW